MFLVILDVRFGFSMSNFTIYTSGSIGNTPQIDFYKSLRILFIRLLNKMIYKVIRYTLVDE